MDKSIALVGLPAAGKSSVGALLAPLTGLPFRDLDAEIEAAAGCGVAQIFRAEGEAGFRTRESEALARLAEVGPLVLATGGGCVEEEANRCILRDRFFTVWLRVRPDAALARSAGGLRPLLEGDAAARMDGLRLRRTPWYEACSVLAVDTDGMDPAGVAEAIYDAIR